MLTLGDLGKAAPAKKQSIAALQKQSDRLIQRASTLQAAGKARKFEKVVAKQAAVATKLQTKIAAKQAALARTLTPTPQLPATTPSSTVTDPPPVYDYLPGTSSTPTTSSGGGGGGAVDTDIDGSSLVDSLAEGSDPNAVTSVATDPATATANTTKRNLLLAAGAVLVIVLLARRKKR